MRSFFFLALFLPFVAGAQINRSAREFASERVTEYINQKLFKEKPYRSVSFGELKTHADRNTGIAWKIEHKFEITEQSKPFDDKTVASHVYKFEFYLDKRMKVVKAESYFSF